MAHTIDNVNYEAYSTSNPLTLAHTTTTGCTVVVLAIVTTANNASRAGADPTYGGQTMTLASRHGGVGYETSIELWYLTAPPVGAYSFSVENTGSIEAILGGVSAKSSTGTSALDDKDFQETTIVNPYVPTMTATVAGDLMVAVNGHGEKDAHLADSHTSIWTFAYGDFGSGQANAQYGIIAGTGSVDVTWTGDGTSEDSVSAGLLIKEGAAPTSATVDCSAGTIGAIGSSSDITYTPFDKIIIEKKVGAGAYSELARPNWASTPYTDTGPFTDSVVYWYKGRRWTGDGTNKGVLSSYSNEDSVTYVGPPLAPQVILI